MYFIFSAISETDTENAPKVYIQTYSKLISVKLSAVTMIASKMITVRLIQVYLLFSSLESGLFSLATGAKINTLVILKAIKTKDKILLYSGKRK